MRWSKKSTFPAYPPQWNRVKRWGASYLRCACALLWTACCWSVPYVWQQCENFKCTTYSLYKRVSDLLKEKQTPLRKFRLLVVATTKGAVKTPARVGKPPNEQPESPQVCHLKTRVHHLTQGVSYNDAGRWPGFGTQQGGAQRVQS